MSDAAVEPDQTNPLFDRLLEALQPEIRESLSEAQRTGLQEAFASATWRRKAVDIRVSLPFLTSRYFLTVIGGREKRGFGRRRAERIFHPLGTVGNVLFLGAICAVVIVMIGAVVLIYNAAFV